MISLSPPGRRLRSGCRRPWDSRARVERVRTRLPETRSFAICVSEPRVSKPWADRPGTVVTGSPPFAPQRTELGAQRSRSDTPTTTFWRVGVIGDCRTRVYGSAEIGRRAGLGGGFSSNRVSVVCTRSGLKGFSTKSRALAPSACWISDSCPSEPHTTTRTPGSSHVSYGWPLFGGIPETRRPSGRRGCRSRSGSPRPTRSVGCRERGCRPPPSTCGPCASGSMS